MQYREHVNHSLQPFIYTNPAVFGVIVMKEIDNTSLENETVVEEATVSGKAKPAKKTRVAIVGAKKGAAAAKKAAMNVAAAPAKLFDKTIYGVCYGISYGAVFTSLMIEKTLPADGMAMKGFHEGAEFARKDFEIRQESQEKHLSPEDSSVVN
jgi:hypothetical protein